MKPMLPIVALVAATVTSAPALASAKLAQAKQCMQCHAMDKDTVGPSFRTIRGVYRGVKNPEAKIVDLMRQGSDANLGPHWGRARMPDGSERPPISDQEARQLARWILGRKG